MKPFIYCCLFSVFLVSCYKETPIPVISDFSLDVENEDYASPVTFLIHNNSSGANQFSWIFEGGDPAFSHLKQPGKVMYKEAGTYQIYLTAWNDYYKETKKIEIVVDSSAIPDFEPRIQVNAFVPATIEIFNRTKGANACEWFFEGGNPSGSSEYHPPLVQYDQPGEYVIRLLVTSGRKTYELTKNVTLLPELNPDFEILPDPANEGMQAPWKAILKNKTVSGLVYRWEAPGGIVDNDTATDSHISYHHPGTYTIQLKADNGKQSKIKTAEIKVLPNTNLYVMEDVRLGINTSNKFGCYYSCMKRRSFLKEEISDKNGLFIDFVFFGLDSDFNYCRFVSPDQVRDYVFDPIPEATHTWITHSDGNALLSVEDFKKMSDDTVLKKLLIKTFETKDFYFQSDVIPRIVLFETSDGRKGAIMIKKFVKEGPDSYILTDIKVQKEKN